MRGIFFSILRNKNTWYWLNQWLWGKKLIGLCFVSIGLCFVGICCFRFGFGWVGEGSIESKRTDFGQLDGGLGNRVRWMSFWACLREVWGVVNVGYWELIEFLCWTGFGFGWVCRRVANAIVLPLYRGFRVTQTSQWANYNSLQGLTLAYSKDGGGAPFGKKWNHRF